jgi:hypothetical protein
VSQDFLQRQVGQRYHSRKRRLSRRLGAWKVALEQKVKQTEWLESARRLPPSNIGEQKMTGEDPTPNIKPYRVLCIDGGGMRGIYTAALLDKLTGYYARLRNEEALDIGKGFDLIAGTSTGAILGCAAAIGRPMAAIVALYEEHGSGIFPHRMDRPN